MNHSILIMPSISNGRRNVLIATIILPELWCKIPTVSGVTVTVARRRRYPARDAIGLIRSRQRLSRQKIQRPIILISQVSKQQCIGIVSVAMRKCRGRLAAKIATNVQKKVMPSTIVVLLLLRTSLLKVVMAATDSQIIRSIAYSNRRRKT